MNEAMAMARHDDADGGSNENKSVVIDKECLNQVATLLDDYPIPVCLLDDIANGEEFVDGPVSHIRRGDILTVTPEKLYEMYPIRADIWKNFELYQKLSTAKSIPIEQEEVWHEFEWKKRYISLLNNLGEYIEKQEELEDAHIQKMWPRQFTSLRKIEHDFERGLIDRKSVV